MERAVAAAKNAYGSWKRTSFAERAACMRKFVEGLKSKQKEFAHALTLEQGKPIGASLAEPDMIQTAQRILKVAELND